MVLFPSVYPEVGNVTVRNCPVLEVYRGFSFIGLLFAARHS